MLYIIQIQILQYQTALITPKSNAMLQQSIEAVKSTDILIVIGDMTVKFWKGKYSNIVGNNVLGIINQKL